MVYRVFAREYRPQAFEEVVGQKHITTTLKNALAQNRIAHAYIFSGPRGTGKTSTARILAKALNCEKGPNPEPCNQCPACREISEGYSIDVIEMDAASHTGVDDVRVLRENVKYAPSSSRYKVYIIDEVHMLSTAAFNALLKTLEEPPPHVIFVLATTEPHKIPLTILSRCQRFDFRRIPIPDIVERLRYIAREESIKIDEGTIFLIAKSAEGSLRDAQSILDQVVSFGGKEVKIEDVMSLLGLVPQEIYLNYAEAIIGKDSLTALDLVDKVVKQGHDLRQFIKGLIEHYRNLVMAKVGEVGYKLIDLPSSEIEEIKKQAGKYSLEDLLRIVKILSQGEEDLKISAQPRFVLEVLTVKLARLGPTVPLMEILKRIESLEARLSQFELEENLPPVGEEKVASKEEIAKVKSNQLKPEVEISLEKIKEIWPAVVDKVKKVKGMGLGSVLERGEPIEIRDKVVTLEFKYSIHKEQVEGNKKAIEAELSQFLNRNFTIACVANNSKGLESGGENEPLATEPKEGEEYSFLKDPIVKSALQIFKGKIVEIKKGKVTS